MPSRKPVRPKRRYEAASKRSAAPTTPYKSVRFEKKKKSKAQYQPVEPQSGALHGIVEELFYNLQRAQNSSASASLDFPATINSKSSTTDRESPVPPVSMPEKTAPKPFWARDIDLADDDS